MIDHAKERNTDAKFEVGSILGLEGEGIFDYVVCNGVLTKKFDLNVSEMNEFAKVLIPKMLKLSRVGVAFNIFSTQVNYFSDVLFYKSPIEMLAFCLSEYSNRVKLDHSYQLYEYTIYLYKE